jgi:hypothetical protein
MPPSDHIIWKIITITVLSAVLMFMLHFNYIHGLELKDWSTLGAIVATYLGIQGAKTLTIPKPEQ